MKRWRSKAYLKLVADLPCYICFYSPSQAHHIKGNKDYSGMGLKAPDDQVMPLCFQHHHELHQHGWEAFETKHHTTQAVMVEATQTRLADDLERLKR